MSNFNCGECGKPILENEDGVYYTFCEHYPPKNLKKFTRNEYLDALIKDAEERLGKQ